MQRRHELSAVFCIDGDVATLIINFYDTLSLSHCPSLFLSVFLHLSICLCEYLCLSYSLCLQKFFLFTFQDTKILQLSYVLENVR